MFCYRFFRRALSLAVCAALIFGLFAVQSQAQALFPPAGSASPALYEGDASGDAQRQITRQLLSRYGLQMLHSAVEANRNLFGLYTATLFRNESLAPYIAQFLRLFPVIADHKSYLDPGNFLENLSRLQIVIDPAIVQQGNAGKYTHSSLTVTLSSDADPVLYHELLHFLDHSFVPSGSYSVYSDGGMLVQGQTETGIYLGEAYSRFLEEAGAEALTARYFTGYTVSYNQGVRFFNALEYIYGSDTMGEIFFDRELRFAQLFLDAGFSFPEFEAINRELFYLLASPSDHVAKLFLPDVLIRLYEKNLPDRLWQEDPVFVYLILSNIPAGSDCSLSQYEPLRQLSEDGLTAYFSRFTREIPEDFTVTSEGCRGSLLFQGDRFLLQFPADYCHGGSSTPGFLTIAYDFENGSVLSYRFTPKPAQLSLDYFESTAE